MHCDLLKGYVEGGTSTKVVFTFSPTAPGVNIVLFTLFHGIPTIILRSFPIKSLMAKKTILQVYESQWKFVIPVHSLVVNLLVVGIVREPEVVFVPTILIIRNSLVGFTTNNEVVLRNKEDESLKFEFKGNSLCNESGKTPVIVEPECGLLKPRSDTTIQ